MEGAASARRGRVSLTEEEPTHEQLFQCLICLGRAQDAQLLRCCVKIVCRDCVHRWLATRHQCPHCRQPLTQSQLTNCPFVDETYEELDKLRTQLNSQKTQCCAEHGLPFSYFCNTCSAAVCSDCAIFASHKGHDFQKLDDVYDAQKSKVQDGVDEIRGRLIDLQVLESEVERNIHEVNKEKEEVAAELNAAFDGVMARLDGHLSSKLIVLARQKEEIADDYKKTTAVMTQVEEAILNSSAADLIAKGPQLLSATQDVCRKPANEIASTIVPHEDFVCELVPTYETGSFTLRRYSALREAALGEATEALYSHELESSSGLVWRLKVYPNGNGVARDQYLSVFVELTDAPDHDSKESGKSRPHATYEYRIEMLNATEPDQPAMVREYASEFEVGECWGYNRFFRIDDLADQGFLDPEQDMIRLTFQVRAQTYYQHSADQARCIKHLRKLQRETAGAEARRGRATRKDALNSSRSPGKSPRQTEQQSPSGKNVRRGTGAQPTGEPGSELAPDSEPAMEPEPEPEPELELELELEKPKTKNETEMQMKLEPEPEPIPESASELMDSELDPERGPDDTGSNDGSSHMASLLKDDLEVDEGAIADDDDSFLQEMSRDGSDNEHSDGQSHLIDSSLDLPDQRCRAVGASACTRQAAAPHAESDGDTGSAASVRGCQRQTRDAVATATTREARPPAPVPSLSHSAPSSHPSRNGTSTVAATKTGERRFRPPARQPPAPPTTTPRQDNSRTSASRAASDRHSDPTVVQANRDRSDSNLQKEKAKRHTLHQLEPDPEPELELEPEPEPELEPELAGSKPANNDSLLNTPMNEIALSATETGVDERLAAVENHLLRNYQQRQEVIHDDCATCEQTRDRERQSPPTNITRKASSRTENSGTVEDDSQRQFLMTSILNSPAELMLDSSLGNANSATSDSEPWVCASTTTLATAASCDDQDEDDNDAVDDESLVAIDWPGASETSMPAHAASSRYSGSTTSQSLRSETTADEISASTPNGSTPARADSHIDTSSSRPAPSPPQPTQEHSREASGRWSSSRRIHMNAVSTTTSAQEQLRAGAPKHARSAQPFSPARMPSDETALSVNLDPTNSAAILRQVTPVPVPVGNASPQRRDLYLEEAPADEVALQVEEVNWDEDGDGDDDQFHDT